MELRVSSCCATERFHIAAAETAALHSDLNQHLAQKITGTELSEGFGGVGERVNGVNDWLQFACGGPFQSFLDVRAVAAVAADEPLLLHKERPEVQRHFATSRRAAGHDRAAAREAFEHCF